MSQNNNVYVTLLTRLNRVIYIKRDNGTFSKVDFNLIKEEVYFEQEKITQQIVYDGNVVVKDNSECFNEAIKSKFFSKVGNIMVPADTRTSCLCLKHEILHDPKKFSSFANVRRDPDNGTLSTRSYYKVVDGVIKPCCGILNYVWYTLDHSSGNFVTKSKLEAYATEDEAKFYGCAKVEGEDNHSWGDIICLNDDEKSIITDAVKKFKEVLDTFKIAMVYDCSDGTLRFTKNESVLPEGYCYEELERGAEDNPDLFQIPDSAYFDTPDKFSVIEITDNWGTFVKHRKEEKKPEDQQ